MPKSSTTAPSGSSRASRRFTTSPPKPSSLQPGVADAGDQDPLHSHHLHLRREEPEKAAGLAHAPRGRARRRSRRDARARRSRGRSARPSRCGPRACAPAGRPRCPARTTTRPPRRNTTPSTSTSGSPRVGSRTAADGRGGSRVTGSRSSMRPCSFRTSSGVTASARSIISFTAGSCSSISARSRVAQRVHVEHERLLDLGVVEEVAAALRRDPRMVRAARSPRRASRRRPARRARARC